MLTFVWTIQVISSLLLIVLILMHSPKGDGIAGIGNAAQMFTSQKSAEKGLNKLTGIVAGIFVLCVFLLGFGIIK
ncbi:TPA: preprotein translocase subunit SecG [Candidatus Gastranaerophilales bacterium HUM_10]|jgi:preprotein translocase, secG subunit|nr:MAG TPA: preprotein translocase subunit SecG [Candidatus Gastranaerophilales bacterium HUM_10]DAB10643.1 MAG TPA: preprotein translocase subunit SecG [Candidatus Gastranaerophilales bacterium HUM_16]DAB14715.1 MAG TPA: preprotein translocase subunit SecG [Candidatus Gastranaerophilales bacterium HUM_19]DAB16220.1 MAG TPA: preprotein translocase subunit SecG [Candidatus Gastranaerophilales bacterium HUM_17]DAB22781.1 MAG TPA: preprotein translocase subunit SecG [Candidatus Gastranaerophilales